MRITKGIVHRDVKPANMLLTDQQEVLLSDFGIAVAAHRTQSLNTQDDFGTPQYMAPEQIQGKPRPASDQYSLAIVVYEWLCGIPPFTGASPLELAMQHLTVPPLALRARIPTISAEVERVVMKALAKDPKERFGSIEEFSEALEQASQQLGTALLVYRGHSAGASAAAWSWDRKWIASSGVEPTITIWDPITGNTYINYTGHASWLATPVQSISWSSDGKFIISRSSDDVHIWEVSTGNTLNIYREMTYSETNYDFYNSIGRWRNIFEAPNRKYTAFITSDEAIHIWDMLTGTLLSSYVVSQTNLKENEEIIHLIRWSPDSKKIAFITGKSWRGDSVHLLEISSGLVSTLYHDPERCLSDVQWESKGRWITITDSWKEEDEVTWEEATHQQHYIVDPTSRSILVSPWKDSLLISSPTGNYIVFAKEEALQIWDVTVKMCILNIAGPQIYIHSVNWSPAGNCVGFAKDETLQIWDINARTCILSAPGTYIQTCHLTWSPTGTHLAMINGKAIQIWDTTKGASQRPLELSFDTEHNLAWSEDGRLFALTDRGTFRWDSKRLTPEYEYGSIIEVWDVVSRTPVLRYNRHCEPVYGIRWMDDGRHLMSASKREVRIWDALSGVDIFSYYSSLSKVERETRWHIMNRTWHSFDESYFCASPDDQRVVAANKHKIQIWNSTTGEPILAYHGHKDDVSAVKWSSDGRYITSTCSQEIRVWDATTGETICTYAANQGVIKTVARAPFDGNLLLISSDLYGTQVKDIITGDTIANHKVHAGDVYAIRWSPDGSYIASAGSDRTVQVWNPNTGIAKLIYREHFNKVRAVAWSPDGSSLASTSVDGVMCVWSATKAQTIFTYRNPLHKLEEVAWSPDGTRLASSVYENPFATQNDKHVHIIIWDTATWAIIATFTDTESYEHALALTWSPDGTHLATAHMNYVNIWDLSTNDPTPILSYHGHMQYINDIEGNYITAITWSPDGKWIASASLDGTVHIWDATRTTRKYTKQAHYKYRGHHTEVVDASWSPDGKYIASSAKDQKIHIWNATTGNTIHT